MTSQHNTDRFPMKSPEGWKMAIGLSGLVAIVFGLIILLFPGKSAAFAMTLIAILVAAYSVVIGVLHLGSALFNATLTGWSRLSRVLLSIVYIIAGVLMTINLESSAVLLTALLGVTIGVVWILEAIVGFTLASEVNRSGWAILGALLSLLAGIALLISPILGAISIWWLLGISMFAIGLVQVIRAFSIKK